MKRSAIISACGLYRYALWRTWGEKKPYIAFIGLNPSIADENIDDPTLRRCVNFAKAWGYSSLCLVNLFAFRATKPSALKYAEDPIGEDCNYYLKQLLFDAEIVVAAWGNEGIYMDRSQYIINNINKEIYCLGITKLGQPKHPLYIKNGQELIKFVMLE